MLANLALNGLEKALRARYRNAYQSKKEKVHLIRYADDFVVTGNSKELLDETIKPIVENFLRERGLELSREKTRITHIEGGFDFLGQNVRKYNGKMLIKPSKQNVKAFMDKVRGIIKENQTATAGNLIVRLNPVIRGWTNYHRSVASKGTFDTVDYLIWKAIWKWARRRHTRKAPGWVKHLLLAARVPIQRHRKIRGSANPYDPDWELYFETRLGAKMEQNLRGRGQLLYLWRQQRGICPNCNQKLDVLGEWHAHHKVWRSQGGGDGAYNRVLLHPNCHRQIHSPEYTSEEPRLVKGALVEA